MQASVSPSAQARRRRLYEILHHGTIGDHSSRLVGRFIVLLIIVNLAAVPLQSVPALAQRYGLIFSAVEMLSLAVFTLEYGLRVWVAVDDPACHHLGPHRARLRYVSSPAGII